MRPTTRSFLPAVVAGLALAALPAQAAAANFSSTGPITINDGLCNVIQEPASPYPSTITVSGLAGQVADVDATLTGLTHGSPVDLRVLLVGPQGQTTLLLHENGNFDDATNLNLIFDDAAAQAPPNVFLNATLTSGTYKPTDQSLGSDFCIGTTSPFPDPAPQAVPYGSTLAGFNGSDPNGIWSLYVVDGDRLDTGSIAGWSLDIDVVAGPTSPAHCKKGGWKTFGDTFKNQGQCVRLFDDDQD